LEVFQHPHNVTEMGKRFPALPVLRLIFVKLRDPGINLIFLQIGHDPAGGMQEQRIERNGSFFLPNHDAGFRPERGQPRGDLRGIPMVADRSRTFTRTGR